ncbi:ASCH domain-containing protein [Carboxylicivirga mesophila]|uniref:ASCH domain-containing protein n=1 Tax=Carboxylicivirga mesophila TaxID=1166478 RepID=A0ABS5KJD9_9BACT|nr:ASCH domain-containing protein [Carboxylicivirga mesophila]MBS2214008.1 ASCH domain-containing protein [Carboxylicivirga mesophila]
MRVLLSIKPEFAEKIFEGTKKFEFRRSVFKNKNVKTVVVYASSPVQRVIGEFEIDSILNDDLQRLWSITKDFSGITENFFFDYFRNKEKGYAIKIKKTKKYKKSLCIKEDFNASPPQSFMYINDRAV